MAQSADSAEDTQHSLMERTSLVAAEGDEEVLTEPIRMKWSRLSLGVIMWSAVPFYIVLHLLLPTEFGHDYLLEIWNEKALAYMPSYGKQGQISSPISQNRLEFEVDVYDNRVPAFGSLGRFLVSHLVKQKAQAFAMSLIILYKIDS